MRETDHNTTLSNWGITGDEIQSYGQPPHADVEQEETRRVFIVENRKP